MSKFSNMNRTQYVAKKNQIINSSIEQLASYSDKMLAAFIYGDYMDNAITLMVRLDDKPRFEYLLNRGVKIGA
jgi:hypothetical protein